ncbi:MAG: hypothetical protein IPN62_17030 [Flavobacteriales bacterium]|nr:hypothetical protein [Flavobacteriales bacterium]
MKNDHFIARWPVRMTLLFGTLFGHFAMAQSVYIPPSPWADEYQGNVTYVKNQGQRFDTDGAVRNDIKFYSRNSPIGLTLPRKAR